MAKYTKHLTIRLKMRNIPESYPKKIHSNPEQRFYDTREKRMIAIKELEYKEKSRKMMIAYDEKETEDEIVTIHPITEESIFNRLLKGRWIEYE